jgi:hypothetical protein
VNYSANLSAVIPTPFFSFANPRRVCLPISPRRNILKALPICSPNSRLQEKSVPKRKAGLNCFITQKRSTKQLSKPIATYVAEYKECSHRRVSRLKRKLITNNFQIAVFLTFLNSGFSANKKMPTGIFEQGGRSEPFPCFFTGIKLVSINSVKIFKTVETC